MMDWQLRYELKSYEARREDGLQPHANLHLSVRLEKGIMTE